MPEADCRRSRTQAALIAHSGSMLYDDVQNIAWLADCNCAKTNGYSGADFLGQMESSRQLMWEWRGAGIRASLRGDRQRCPAVLGCFGTADMERRNGKAA